MNYSVGFCWAVYTFWEEQFKDFEVMLWSAVVQKLFFVINNLIFTSIFCIFSLALM